MALDPTVFQQPECAFDGDLVVATYSLATEAPDLMKAAESIAVGQTTGGWVGLPRASRDVLVRVVGRVLSVVEIPPEETPLPTPRLRQALVRVGFPVGNVAGDLGALLVACYGKVSLDGAIKLVDLEVPGAFARACPGPRHGIEGVRAMLHDAAARPLVMSIFKPALGLPPETLADMLREQAEAGMDLVKDDEVLADATLDDALRRAEACLEAIERVRAATGHVTVHAVSLTGPVEELVARARRLSRAGVRCLLFNALAYGLPTLAALARDGDVTAALMAHPALAGGLVMDGSRGIASHVLLGKLMRLAGADLVLYPSCYGRIALRREAAMKTALALTRPLHGVKPALPVPSAGITPAVVPRLLADHGPDVVVNAGGAVHGHPDGARAGAEAFVAAVRATRAGTSLADAARGSRPLARALEVWA
jgi:2,3-diketo-5-methylthiopentyl-1-phosphate enolase